MADGLHEISQAIGKLQAEAESSQRQRALIFDKLDEINEKLTPLASMPQHMADHCRELDLLKGYLNKAKGATWGVRVIWGLLSFIGIGGVAWLGNAAIEKKAAEFDDKVKRIERNMPSDYLGRR